METPERILIVDDNPTNRRVLVGSLGKVGYAVKEAVDGIQALELAEDWAPDLILLDVNMPGLDGFEVCELLKANARHAAVPVIFLTALNTPEDVERAFSVGGSDYVTKPFHLSEVKARTLVHLRLRRAERELVQAHKDLLQTKKLESLTRLTNGIAHELHTPIQFVGDNLRFLGETFLGVTKLLLGAQTLAKSARDCPACTGAGAELENACEELDLDFMVAEIPAAVEQSLGGLQRMGDIIEALKESTNSSGESKRTVAVAEIIEGAVASSRPEWEGVAELETSLDPHLAVLLCQPENLVRVLHQLIQNAAQAIACAADAGPSAKGRITVSTRLDGATAELAVSDTGPGIPDEIRERVFDPFFTTRDVGQGTGNGLCIARRMVVGGHQGTLDFRTEVGVGTTFVIRIPIAAGEQPVAA